ncbi:hypothetical protein PGT21_003234 [Puccinia graminis f. sp. tritici]|uniref:Uncharacterized protein n=1 Tax=Puccinia graminis f. sp. tritici TaxID=56615 RepID=A0A5B0P644_PUCGR|nr:hypothetical protein PGT21_003234 [Puccinia graminis f. sp. tritici]
MDFRDMCCPVQAPGVIGGEIIHPKYPRASAPGAAPNFLGAQYVPSGLEPNCNRSNTTLSDLLGVSSSQNRGRSSINDQAAKFPSNAFRRAGQNDTLDFWHSAPDTPQYLSQSAKTSLLNPNFPHHPKFPHPNASSLTHRTITFANLLCKHSITATTSQNNIYR